jgi:hypothetical protein
VRTSKAAPAMAVLLAATALSLGGEAVVLRGGATVQLKAPPVRSGNTVLLTRTDGTLLSVPASEIDEKATAALKAAPPPPASTLAAPPETPAEIARLSREGPKARVKITDRDVAHELAPGVEVVVETRPGVARIEVGDYTQQKAEANLLVKGTLRNSGGTQASNVRMTITAQDQKGESIGSNDASLSAAVVEPGQKVEFTASLPIGERVVSELRFAPRWVAAPLPPPPGEASAAARQTNGAAGAPAAGSRPPEPKPTPYGRGTLYANPQASASNTPPADGKTGYIPGASSPEDQPKPPQ